ncbi:MULTISPECIES: RagB/SusD family nutrient uptake outer membrane protein [unclassified Chryseobacterium]|uniref:RagB/SusD family nutrient uptake outer membrane protein n=1 Tax=unclassified Chryseobacterium TaxID=2593645 RepID=UPI000F44A2E9|nr:RagB/SusD family nutrient uptake outer membrane protein [Chryseobacterium sp. G0240]ROI06396.1 RagB/SusD family nutrient uptake outer membrane protein [Chryseobacterium sp. G0240]
MKKNIIKISLAALTAFVSLTSCDRNLDQVSSINEPVEQAMSRPESFRQALDGAYTSLKGAGYYSGDTGSQLIMGDLTTDNLIRTASGRNSNFAASNFEFSSDNSQTTGLYSAAYLVISRANFVLANTNNGVLSGTQKANIEAEARALRAIVHFDLVRAYSKIPTQSADAKTSIGIYYAEKYDPLNNSASRNLTVEQVYDKIIADLLFAADNITQNDADKGRLSKAAVYGLLSRVNLYKGDYDNTIKYGELALGLSPSVTQRANFSKIWKDKEGDNINDGVLFQVLNSAAEQNTVGVAYNQAVPALRSEFVVDYDLYTAYTASDVRKPAYFTTSAYSGETYNHVTKYAGNGGPANIVPIKYLRGAEVLLNVAEAYYRSGNPASALTLLNKLRNERYSSFTPGTETGQALLDAILKERRLELAFENDRWYTLKRLGLSVQRSGKGDLFDGTGAPAVEQTLSAGSYKWQWPIPITAIQANPNIKQNDKY